MLFIFIQLLLSSLALEITETYRTKGLKVIDIDLDKYDELISGETTLAISLNYSSNSSYPVLSYCSTNDLQNIKTILSSLQSVKTHIESNKKHCVFDNDALLYQQELQQFVLCDYLNVETQEMLNRFSIFGMNSRKFSIYVHSIEDSLYSLKISTQISEQLNNSCNRFGTNSNTQPSFCICNLDYFGSSCQLKGNSIRPSNMLILDLPSNQQKIYAIPLESTSSVISIFIDASTSIEAMLSCYLEKEYMPFLGSKNYELHTLRSGSVLFQQVEIQECKKLYNQINEKFNVSMEGKLAFLLTNPSSQIVSVTLKVEQTTSDNVKVEFTIYYIMIVALSLLFLGIIIISFLANCYQKSGSINQRRTNLEIPKTKFYQKQVSLDFIPQERYEQIIEKYPGLSSMNECQICLVEFEKEDLVKFTYCLHLFHSSCLDEWRLKIQACPFCRDQLTKSKYQDNEEDDDICQLGVVIGDDMQIDAKKIEKMSKRKSRLQQLKCYQPESETTIKETSPSSGVPLKFQMKKEEQ